LCLWSSRGGPFGEATFEVIEAEPDRLKEVAGIRSRRAARIVAGLAQQKAVQEIMLFLHAHGAGKARGAHPHTKTSMFRCQLDLIKIVY
jgi:hypothetical protein